MILYHSTTRENAARILRDGFCDRTDYYMTSQLHTGVWLSDMPENEGARSEARLCLKRLTKPTTQGGLPSGYAVAPVTLNAAGKPMVTSERLDNPKVR